MVELLKLIHCVNSMFDLNIYSYTVSIYFSALCIGDCLFT